MLVTLDFETYFDKDYTLTKLSTSEYIRDSRFDPISCSIKLGKNKPFCYFGRDAIELALSRIDWKEAILLCHHTQFDGLILSHHFGVVPKRYADTLSMARALHPKAESVALEAVAKHYGKTNKLTMPDFKGKHVTDLTDDDKKAIIAYNNADVQATYDIYEEMVKGFPVTELDLIDITCRMFCDPVLRVDMQLAERELLEEQERKRKAIEASGVQIDVLSSNTKFAAALKALGVDVPTKPSPSIEGKRIPAIAKSDEALQALLSHPHPQVVALVEGRLAAKSTIGESRAQRMLDRGKHGTLPIYLAYCGAHTFRWSGGDKFNPQNFKQAQKVGGKLREAIIAPPGHVLVVVDASQIEARIVAWLAGEEWILDAYRNKRDLYCEFGTEAYGRTITKADKEERFVSKTCVLLLGFQGGGPKLQVTVLNQSINQGMAPVRLPIEVCYGLVNSYRSQCQKIVQLWNFMNDEGIGALISGKEMQYGCLKFSKGKILLPSGLSLLYPGISADIVQKTSSRFFKGGATKESIQNASYLTSKGRSKIYGGLLTENVVQALARIVVADAMRKVAEKHRIAMMTHDEIVFIAPEVPGYATSGDIKLPQDQWHPALVEALEIMRTPPEWAPDLPLDAEGGWDVPYSK